MSGKNSGTKKAKKSSTAGKAFGDYKYLSPQDQLNGLRNRCAQLEAEHMNQRIRKLEVGIEAENDESVTIEMLDETHAAIDKTLASLDRRMELINDLIAEYEESGDDNE